MRVSVCIETGLSAFKPNAEANENEQLGGFRTERRRCMLKEQTGITQAGGVWPGPDCGGRNERRLKTGVGAWIDLWETGGYRHVEPYCNFVHRYNCMISCLIQCRSNHSRLKSYLYRLGREESGECECGTGQETVRHVLLACPR